MEKEKEWSLTKPQNFRDMHDVGFIEVVCPHGVGHHKGVHGCDLQDGEPCCKSAPKELWDKVSSE